MQLNQPENSNSIHNLLLTGLIWFSMVYYIINNSIHYIVYTNPLNQYIYMVICEIKYLIIIIPHKGISLENWFSGLPSRPLRVMVNRAKPERPSDCDRYWFSSLDSITGV